MKTIFLALVALLSPVIALGAAGAAAAAKPNIILILGDLSCYPQDPAYPDAPMRTPNLDSLASQGVKFMQAYSQTMCSPARASLLTGRFSQRFGFYDNGCAAVGLPKTEMTMAELLREQGYATACFGKWHVGHRPGFRPLERGFDRFYGFLGAAHDYFKPSVGTDTEGDVHEGSFVYDQDRPVTAMKHLTDQLTDETLDFVRSSGRSQKPFFIYLAYNAPHGPMQPRPDTLEEFKRMPAQEPGRTLARALEDGIDTNVGRILRELFLSRLETNTIVIFSSDNGGNEYETPAGIRTVEHNGGLRGTKFMTWEGGFRVPLIIRWPGQFPQGATFSKPVNLVDLYATLAAAAGVTISAARQLDGVDLLPFVTGRNSGTPHEIVYACNNMDGEQWSVRKGDWKLVNDYPDTSFFQVRPRPATIAGLYNMAQSPKERKNQISAFPAIAEELRKLHDEFDASCPPSIAKQTAEETAPRNKRMTNP
jgi:arylsulfatase A-like enzyme